MMIISFNCYVCVCHETKYLLLLIMMTTNHMNYDQDDSDIDDGNHDDADYDNDQ